jgi:hypothetical protein
MNWYINGESYACCSCSVGCPCAVGEMETTGSDGCSAVQIIEIHAGEVAGTDVGGTKLAAVVDWPGPMMAGGGTGRLYFDVETSADQRTALEALFTGKLGGAFSRIPELVPERLSSRLAAIVKSTSDTTTSIVVEGFGRAVLAPHSSPQGEPIHIHGAGGFRDDVVLAIGAASWWRDPELRQWEGGGYAERSEVDWSGQGEFQATH